jgi:hypothetical protein
MANGVGVELPYIAQDTVSFLATIKTEHVVAKTLKKEHH